jgi:hypothetical protein
LFHIVIPDPVVSSRIFIVQLSNDTATDEISDFVNLIKLLSKTFTIQYKSLNKDFAFALENIAQ